MKRVMGMLVLMGSASLVGCRSYEPRPVDPAAHRAAFLARLPESAELQGFVRALRERGGEAGASFDLADGVTLAEAEAVAMVFNAELREARASAGVSLASASHAGLWEDPVLGIDLARVLESVPDPLKASAALGLTLPVSGRLEAERRRAGAEHAAELARLAGREWSVRAELRRAWARWTALALRAESAREVVDRLEGVLSAIDAAERAGEMASAEAGLVRIEVARRRAEAATLESLRDEAALLIHRLAGLSPEVTLTLDPVPLRGQVGDEPPGWPVEGRANPAVTVAAAEYLVAEHVLETEIRRQYPDLVVGPGLGTEEGRAEVRLGISIPLPLANRNRRNIAEASALREAARVRLESAVERAESDLREARLRLSAARARRQSLEQELLPLVERQYESVRRALALGEARTYVLLESLVRLQDARQSAVESALEETLAGIRVEEILGPPAEARPAGQVPTHRTSQGVAP